MYNIYCPVNGTSEIYVNFCKKLFNSTNRNDSCIHLSDWNLLLNNRICCKEIRVPQEKVPDVDHHFEEGIDIHDIIEQKLKFTYTKKYITLDLDRVYIKEHDQTWEW